MSNVPVFYGIGRRNMNQVKVMKHVVLDAIPTGEAFGSDDYRFVKLCDSVSDLPSLPDVRKLIAARHYELCQKISHEAIAA